jgi:hypothetical protein
MHKETALGSDVDFAGLICDLLNTLRPLARQHKVSFDTLGDLTALADRVHAEVAASNTVVNFVPLVGAWSRRSINSMK